MRQRRSPRTGRAQRNQAKSVEPKDRDVAAQQERTDQQRRDDEQHHEPPAPPEEPTLAATLAARETHVMTYIEVSFQLMACAGVRGMICARLRLNARRLAWLPATGERSGSEEHAVHLA